MGCLGQTHRWYWVFGAVLCVACTSDRDATWHGGVKQALGQCATCHFEGGIAPFSLHDPQEVRTLAPLITEALASGDMPPWLPGPLSPPLRDDPTWSAADHRLWKRWVERGFPLGELSDASPVSSTAPSEELTPDVVLSAGEGYVPQPADEDDYRCFLVDLNLTAPQSEVAFQVFPGDLARIHHVVAGVFPGELREELLAVDESTPGLGWPCFGALVPEEVPNATAPLAQAALWLPGQPLVRTFPGTAIALPANSVAVVQLHVFSLSSDALASTEIELFFTPEPLEPVQEMVLGTRTVEIASDDPQAVVRLTTSARNWMNQEDFAWFSDDEIWAVGARAHGHLLMVRHRITLRPNTDHARILLDIPQWDYHWQGQYLYQEPIPFSPDDLVQVECVYDNSASHRSEVGLDPSSETVSYGTRPDDEMCGAGVFVVRDDPRGP